MGRFIFEDKVKSDSIYLYHGPRADKKGSNKADPEGLGNNQGKDAQFPTTSTREKE